MGKSMNKNECEIFSSNENIKKALVDNNLISANQKLLTLKFSVLNIRLGIKTFKKLYRQKMDFIIENKSDVIFLHLYWN